MTAHLVALDLDVTPNRSLVFQIVKQDNKTLLFFNRRSDEAGGEEPFEDEQYIYYDDEVDFEDARSREEVDRLDTAETSYAKNRLRDEPHLAKAAKARLQSAAATAAKGKYGSGGNRDAFQFCREIAQLASFFKQ